MGGGGGCSGLQFQKGAFWKIWTKIYCSARNLLVHHSSLSHTTYVETNKLTLNEPVTIGLTEALDSTGSCLCLVFNWKPGGGEQSKRANIKLSESDIAFAFAFAFVSVHEPLTVLSVIKLYSSGELRAPVLSQIPLTEQFSLWCLVRTSAHKFFILSQHESKLTLK